MFILHFPIFHLQVFSSWDRKLVWVDILPDAYFTIPETFLLFLHLSDASNLHWLISNSPGLVNTCRLWESSCQRGSLSPAIALCVTRASACPCRGITKWKESRGLGSLCWAARLHPGLAPDHSWVKLLLLFWIYIRAKLLDDGKHSPEVSIFFPRENQRAARTHMTSGFCPHSSCSVPGFPECGQPGFGLWLAALWPPPPVVRGIICIFPTCQVMLQGFRMELTWHFNWYRQHIRDERSIFLDNFLPLGMAADIPDIFAFLWLPLHPHLPQILSNNS